MNQSQPVLSQLTNLKSLFAGRLFRVPDYQRGYSWEATQVKDLLSDIEQIDTNRRYQHFTGTIVLADPEETSFEADRLHVVDGQQRLTTLIMLLARLRIHGNLSDEDRFRVEQAYLQRGDPRSAVPVLALNTATNSHFGSFVLKGILDSPAPEMVSHRRLLDAIFYIDEWLSARVLTGNEVLDRVTERLGFIVFKPGSSDEVGLMFEVINNRGKALSELEKVKNYLIYYSVKADAPKLRKRIDSAWSTILKNLSIADGLHSPDEHLFMRSACITYFGFRKTESNAAYKALKNSFPVEEARQNWEELDRFIDFLERASIHYMELRSDNDSARERLRGKSGVIEQINFLGSQKAIASILPCYLALMAVRDQSLLDSRELEEALSVLEKLNFRVYLSHGGARRSDSGQGSLFDIASRIYQLHKPPSTLAHMPDRQRAPERVVYGFIDELVAFALDYSSLSAFEHSLNLDKNSSIDFGNWGSLRYFLMNYEQQFNEKATTRIRDVNLPVREDKPDDFPSIEHILAQAHFPDGIGDEHSGWLKRRLGNFVLLELGVNKRARDKSLDKKVGIYSAIDGSQMRQVRSICKDFEDIVASERDESAAEQVSTVETLINNHEWRLKKFAVGRWRFPGE